MKNYDDMLKEEKRRKKKEIKKRVWWIDVEKCDERERERERENPWFELNERKVCK